MTMLKERNFAHDGKGFVLRLFETESGFVVIAYLDDEQVSPSYGDSFETDSDYFAQHQKRITDHLFETAMSDIKDNVYIGA